MKLKILISLGMSLAALALAGCGGGGTAPANTTTISGLASKGPINGGTVKVFAIRNGQQAEQLGQSALTDAGGRFNVPVGAYSGPAVVEVTGGTFADEATGLSMSLNSSTFLRTAVPDTTAGATTTVAVTPLTELAYRKAKGAGTFTTASINDANNAIADTFGLTDIVNILPVAGGATADQKNYAFALGVFSQLVKDDPNTAGDHPEEVLERVLNTLGDEVERNGNLSVDDIIRLATAVTNFKSSGNDRSGGAISIIIPTTGLLKISTAGTPNTIGAIDMIVNLPAGVTVSADATSGEASAGVVTVSGVAAAGSNKQALAKFTAATATTPAQLRIGLINTTGFGLGEVVTIKFDRDAVVAFPSVADFSVTGFTASGVDGAALSGITVAPVSIGAGS